MTMDTKGIATNSGQTKAASLTAPAIPQTARWLALSAVSGSVLFTFSWFILGFVSPGYSAGAGVGVAGLTGRLLIVEVCAWFVAMGWMAFRRSGPVSSTNEDGYGLNHALGEV